MIAVSHLSNNDKRYDSSNDLAYVNLPNDKQKRKRRPCLKCAIYLERIV